MLRTGDRLVALGRAGRLLASLAILTAFVGTLTPSARAAALEGKDREAVEKLFVNFSGAFNRHDAKAAAWVCAEDVDYIVGDGSDIKGRKAVEEHLAAMFANRLRDVHRNASLQEVRLVAPDAAALIGHYETTGGVGSNGALDPPTQGVYDWVATKNDGRWLISLWHESNLPMGGPTGNHPTPGASGMQPAATLRSEFKPGDVVDVPMFFREDWKIPAVTHEGVFGRENVANPNLDLTLYGSPESRDPLRDRFAGMQVESGPDPANFGHIFTGFCGRPCGMTLRDKSNYVDLSGSGKIRWFVKVSGLHQVHPVIKLADGTWLLGEHGDGVFADYHAYEFTLSDTRWIHMDMDKVVTRGRWLDTVDLSKVDEVGFADLIPGSGHHPGGWITMSWFEVYGKSVPRSAGDGASTAR